MALQAFLRVLAEPLAILRADIDRLGRNWFIETCDDWVVPYLAELIGETSPPPPGPSVAGLPRRPALIRALAPRSAVANALAHRRRKGTIRALQDLTVDLTGWAARAVEQRGGTLATPDLRRAAATRPRRVDFRDLESLDRAGGPFDALSRRLDRRTPGPLGTGRGRASDDLAVFVWQQLPTRVDRGPALFRETMEVGSEHCRDPKDPQSRWLHSYTFDTLGRRMPLLTNPLPVFDPTGAAAELEVPAPIRRGELADASTRPLLYGPGRSLMVWCEQDGKEGAEPELQPVPAEKIVVADLVRTRPRLANDQVAIDPAHGLLARETGPSEPPRMRVTYHYGRLADLGGGDYDRRLANAEPGIAFGRVRQVNDFDPDQEPLPPGTTFFGSIASAVAALRTAKDGGRVPAVIVEIDDDSLYAEAWSFDLRKDESLEIRAAVGRRPTVTFAEEADVTSSGGSLTLDGLWIGGSLRLTGRFGCVRLRDVTLVPPPDGPSKDDDAALWLTRFGGMLRVARSVLGRIGVSEADRHAEPASLVIWDSILDGRPRMAGPREHSSCGAIASGDCAAAYVALTAERITVLGRVLVHQVDSALDCLFADELVAARAQIGSMSFCYSPAGPSGRFRTPRRFQCLPDPGRLDGTFAVPRFVSLRFGDGRYLQPSPDNDPALLHGASDRGELGAYHDLFLALKRERLADSLAEFTPIGHGTRIVTAD